MHVDDDRPGLSYRRHERWKTTYQIGRKHQMRKQ